MLYGVFHPLLNLPLPLAFPPFPPYPRPLFNESYHITNHCTRSHLPPYSLRGDMSGNDGGGGGGSSSSSKGSDDQPPVPPSTTPKGWPSFLRRDSDWLPTRPRHASLPSLRRPPFTLNSPARRSSWSSPSGLDLPPTPPTQPSLVMPSMSSSVPRSPQTPVAPVPTPTPPRRRPVASPPSPSQLLEALLDTPPEETRRRRSLSSGSASQHRLRDSSSSISSNQPGPSSTTPGAETTSRDAAPSANRDPFSAASSAAPVASSTRIGGASHSYMGSVFAGPSSSSVALPPLEEEEPSPSASSVQLDHAPSTHSAPPGRSSSQPTALRPSSSTAPTGEDSSSSSTAVPPRTVPPSPSLRTQHLLPASAPSVGQLSSTVAGPSVQRAPLPSGPSINPPVPPVRHRRSVSFDLNPQYYPTSSVPSRGRVAVYALGNTPGPVRYPKPATVRRAPSPKTKSPYPAEFSPETRAPKGIKNIVIIGGGCFAFAPFILPSPKLHKIQHVPVLVRSANGLLKDLIIASAAGHTLANALAREVPYPYRIILLEQYGYAFWPLVTLRSSVIPGKCSTRIGLVSSKDRTPTTDPRVFVLAHSDSGWQWRLTAPLRTDTVFPKNTPHQVLAPNKVVELKKHSVMLEKKFEQKYELPFFVRPVYSPHIRASCH